MLTQVLKIFIAGKGCGIDMCTPAPVTALSLLSRPGEELDTETVLALILTEFERLWNAFVAGQGSWAPFEEDYLDAWMHSYVFCPISVY
jgi:biotin--protein ligase